MVATEPSELFAPHLAALEDRLARALAHAEADALVIYAGEEKLVHRDDIAYPFVAEPYFRAWLPVVRAPGSVLIVEPGKRPVLAYLQTEDFWHEPPATPEGHWTAHVDVQVMRSVEAVRAAVRPYAPRAAAIGEAADESLGFRSINAARLLRFLDYHRAKKTGYEVASIRAAADVAVVGHRAVAARFGPEAAELDLHLEYCRASRQRETELPYANIVALNEHAATLHYQNLRRRPPVPVRSLLIDAGAQCNGYACDITRTWHGASGRFAELCAAMETLQQTLCDAARSGIDFVALNDEAHRRLADLLCTAGLVRGTAEQTLDAGITRAFLPHGLGHLLGLQVHDAGGRQVDPEGAERPPPEHHPFLRLTRVLEEGFVVTIEPGLYFIPALLDRLPATAARLLDRGALADLIPCGGIRIEDDVLVGAETPRNLTREAFAAAAAA